MPVTYSLSSFQKYVLKFMKICHTDSLKFDYIWNRSHRIIQVNGRNHDLFASFPDSEYNFDHWFAPVAHWIHESGKKLHRCAFNEEKKLSNWQGENQLAVPHEYDCSLRTTRKLRHCADYRRWMQKHVPALRLMHHILFELQGSEKKLIFPFGSTTFHFTAIQIWNI